MIKTNFEKAKEYLINGGEIKVIMKDYEKNFSINTNCQTDDTEIYFGEWYIIE